MLNVLYESPLKRAVTLTVTACILLFQNCSGFSAFEQSDLITEQHLEDIRLETVSGKELHPIEIQFPVSSKYTPLEMPRGAHFDHSSKTFLWLPQRGQAGAHSVTISGPTDTTTSFDIVIDPIKEETLKSGPPDIYKDGDIGFVFVHGAGKVDRCRDREDLAKYWGAGVDVIAPERSQRLVTCYDGRSRVSTVAPSVASQILAAPCGRFNKCIVITHSMGGLLMEHIFTHIREARPTDPEPYMYQHRNLYKDVRDKTLFVISIASAAGGSKVADIVNDPSSHEITQTMIGQVSRWLGENDESTQNLTVEYASNVVAPMQEDGGIPFFMVAGYSERIIRDPGAFFDNWFDQLFDNEDDKLKVFNGDSTLTTLDSVAQFDSRSDGLVAFRSACGVMSNDKFHGPGHDADLREQLEYCFNSKKKPNHFAWFTMNLNHFYLSTAWPGCNHNERPCFATFYDSDSKSLYIDERLTGVSALHVIRNRLTANQNDVPTIKHVVEDGQLRTMASVPGE